MIPIGLSVMTVAFHYYVIAALFDGYLIFMGIEALVALGLSKMILNDADNKSLSISNALSIVTLVVLSPYISIAFTTWGCLVSVIACLYGINSSNYTLNGFSFASSSTGCKSTGSHDFEDHGHHVPHVHHHTHNNHTSTGYGFEA